MNVCVLRLSYRHSCLVHIIIIIIPSSDGSHMLSRYRMSHHLPTVTAPKCSSQWIPRSHSSLTPVNLHSYRVHSRTCFGWRSSSCSWNQTGVTTHASEHAEGTTYLHSNQTQSATPRVSYLVSRVEASGERVTRNVEVAVACRQVVQVAVESRATLDLLHTLAVLRSATRTHIHTRRNDVLIVQQQVVVKIIVKVVVIVLVCSSRS